MRKIKVIARMLSSRAGAIVIGLCNTFAVIGAAMWIVSTISFQVTDGRGLMNLGMAGVAIIAVSLASNLTVSYVRYRRAH